MKKLGILILFAGITTAFMFTNHLEVLKAEEEIKKVIMTGYVHGAFNELNPEAMKTTFHEDFAIFTTDGEKLNRYEISDWVKRTAERKADPEFDPSENVWEANFASVDVNGDAASVKIELFHEGEQVFTDYLSLLKFDQGWRIVAKVYHRHID
jgi:hypothetical protein